MNFRNNAKRNAERSGSEHDQSILMSDEVQTRAPAVMQERLGQGMAGIVQDLMLFARAPDYDTSEIKARTLLFHGSRDVLSPIGSVDQLRNAIPDCTLHVLPELGHHHMFAEWDMLLAAAAGLPFTLPDGERRGVYELDA